MNKPFKTIAAIALLALLSVSGCRTAGPGNEISDEVAADMGLPPDPGEAGKETVAGIDSDSDGVRDDIQRWIVLTYPDEPNTQQALFQIAKAKQDSLLNSTDKKSAVKAYISADKANECLWSIKRYEDISLSKPLFKIIHNTYERTRAWNSHMGLVSGSTVAANSAGIKACEFSVLDK